MDYGTFKALLDEVGPERILILYFDNDRVEYFPDGDFNPDDMMEINGNLVFKSKSNILSKGVTGGKYDIPITMYNAELQAVAVLDDVKDRDRIDRHTLYIN